MIVDTTLTTAPTGGAQTFLVDLCEALSRKGWRVAVVSQPGPEGAILASLRAAGAKVYTNVWRATHLPEERGARLAAWVNEVHPDLYVVSISSAAGWLALPLLDADIATLSIAHNDVSAFYAPLAHYAPFIDCAIGVSEETYRQILAHSSLPPGRVRQIPYGVRALSAADATVRYENQEVDGTPLRIGYVGRLVQEQKRVRDFVALARELELKRVSFELHLIGDGRERSRLEDEFKLHALDHRVKFWGWLAPTQVKRRLLELDIFVLMSDHEGLPVALLEAMGQALVPVVTRIASGNAQLVEDGQNGYTVPIGDIKTFGERLAHLAGDRAQLRAMKRAAWATSQQYSLERMVERYLACFDYVTGREFSREHRRSAPRPYPVMPSCVSRYPFWLRKTKQRLLGSIKTARSLVSAPHHSV